MRVLTDDTRAAMNSYVKDGPYRYYWRATVEKAPVLYYPYDTAFALGGDYGHDRDRTGNYSSIIFSGRAVHEIPNIQSGQIVRDLDQDIAELTLTVLNTMIAPMGTTEDQYTGSLEYDEPGALSFDRGAETIEDNRWGHTENTGWQDYFCPDRLIRTYEGYGIDESLPPGVDPAMYASGCWLIDTVQMNDQGQLVIKARDLGRILVDHIAMPPNIPWDSYPMEWSTIRSELVTDRAPTGGDWSVPHGDATSSNQAYLDAGIVDKPTYVKPGGTVMGHRENDPIRDGNGHWLSTGQTQRSDMVWWEVDLDSPVDMAALRLKTWGGPYVVYVSLHDGDGWIGNRKIPYNVSDVLDSDGNTIPLGARIPFVHRERFDRNARQDIVLKRKYGGVRKVRLTFSRLRREPGARVYPWRAGLSSIELYTGSLGSLGFDDSGERLKSVGNYADYSAVVKWICAWSGFWWPERNSESKISYGPSDTHQVTYDYESNDAALVKGRVWGAFQQTGTSGVADLTADQFDKQPLLDCIQVVRNIVGFNFYVDETGGIVWRMPNLYQKGNYRTPSHLNEHGRQPAYVTDTHETLDEQDVLSQYSTTLDSKNLRERIGVAASNGKVGSVIKGYTPYYTGLRRIALWTDEHFESNRECRVAADMIAAQQMFSWRTSVSVTQPNPAIQIDDQIRIYERTTNETFFHYVKGISMEYDGQHNKGTYTIQSHWLGERISDAWVVRPDQLDAFTQHFLDTLGPVE